MKYNIVTVASNAYYEPFLKLFVNSAIKHLDMNFLNTIYILEKDINPETIKILSDKHSAITFENLDYTVNITNINSKWSHTWRTSVIGKYIYTYEKVKQSDFPCILVDLDSFFIKDFYDLIDLRYDIQVCDRKCNISNKSLIASYVSFNNKVTSLNFLEEWIKLIEEINEDVVDTTALNILYTYKKYNIGLLPYTLISYYYDINTALKLNTRILHLKGCDPSKNVIADISDRTKRIVPIYNLEEYN